MRKGNNMKKRIIAYAIIIAVLLPIWIHWGGFKNDMGTLILALAGVFAGTVFESKQTETKKAE